MKAERSIFALRRLREQPLWRLLAADNGPAIIAILQAQLAREEKSIPASIFHERIERDLEDLRAQGESLPQTAQAYVSTWLREGYLERRFPEGSQEERYELSAAALDAMQFLEGIAESRVSATESRLALVIQQLARLAEESDPNPRSRIAALQAERDRIDREIEAIEKGEYRPMPDDRALERIREIVGLARELAGDFRHVRDQFEQLNRNLRERVLDLESDGGSRGEVLADLFSGVDVIADSDAGKTFEAFWRLLTDPEQGAALDDSLERILQRPFAAQLESAERRFILRLTRTLLSEGGEVHDVLQGFARGLKQFVQSQEYLEQRRLNRLLKEAQALGLSLKDSLSPHAAIGFDLQLTTGRVRSYSQWTFYDPSRDGAPPSLQPGDGALVDLATLGEWVAQSEIDFRELKSNIQDALRSTGQVSIGELLLRYPATQGLGSVVGYLSLASKHAVRSAGTESVTWTGLDREERRAGIPVLYFLKEKAHEL